MRTDAVRVMRRALLLVIVLAVLAGIWSARGMARAGEGPTWLQLFFGPPQPLAGWRIGIVAGHGGHDPGAVCPDGLTEAEINRAVAEAVARALRQRGASVDLLAEFDGRLAGYRADAFVSIHADSCEVNLSGFKVATLEGGSADSARLADCLWQRYAVVTGLRPHPDTITYDMRDYHAFREIAAETPAAIIEIGFLKGDRSLLTGQPEQIAAGIIEGVECFLEPKPLLA
jgi:N-acetylmuramoyl-L-alanine amidase